jgi:hypothetical protein
MPSHLRGCQTQAALELAEDEKVAIHDVELDHLSENSKATYASDARVYQAYLDGDARPWT